MPQVHRSHHKRAAAAPSSPHRHSQSCRSSPRRTAPPPGRSTSSAPVLASDMISKHPHFTPLGRRALPGGARGARVQPPAHRPHDVGVHGGVGGGEGGAADSYCPHLLYEAKCASTVQEGNGKTDAVKRRRARPLLLDAPARPHAASVKPCDIRRCSSTASRSARTTAEACVAGWCATFVDGCLVVQGVRNKGGAIRGSTDMRREDTTTSTPQAEARSSTSVRHLRQVKLPESDANKFKIHSAPVVEQGVHRVRQRLPTS